MPVVAMEPVLARRRSRRVPSGPGRRTLGGAGPGRNPSGGIHSIRGWPGGLYRTLGLLWLVSNAACSRCPSGAGDADVAGDAPCTEASCTDLCMDGLGCGGRCRDGTCFCLCLDAAADDARPDDARSDVDGETAGEDARDGRDADGGEGGDGCMHRPTFESRPQATPGLECRRLSVDEIEDGLLRYAAAGSEVIITEATDPSLVWRYSRPTDCWEKVEETEGAAGDAEVIISVAVESQRLAFSTTWEPAPETQQCELRWMDLSTREVEVLEHSLSPYQPGRLSGCSMHPIALEYPWVVWRDIRRISEMFYPWDAMAKNIETGETINLSIDPITGRRDWSGAVDVDLKGGLAVWPASYYVGDPPRPFGEIVSFDLGTRARQQVTDVIHDQFAPAVTEDWIAWVDLREEGGGTMIACAGDIYGYDRRTGEEHALVAEGDAMHGPWLDAEGPWLVYTDHRWDPESRCDTDREASVVAFHLPTRTEVRITDWPGWEAVPSVVHRDDGTYGILLIEEVSYIPDIHRLWDCDLPDLGG